MNKRQFNYLLSFRINIPINELDLLSNAIQKYNQENGLQMDNSFIRLFSDTNHFELKDKVFGGRGKRISINRTKSLLRQGKASLYIGNEMLFLKQKCTIKNNQITLFADDMFYTLPQSVKDISKINNEISTIVALVEFFNGDLVFSGELNERDNMVITYKEGEELHVVENSGALCEKIYTEYKVDIIYCTGGVNLSFFAHVDSNERTLLSEELFLRAFLNRINQSGGDIVVYENTEINRIDMILYNTQLSDMMYHHLDTEKINFYNKETIKYQNTLEEYKDEKYIKYFSIGVKAMKENSVQNFFNLSNVYKKMDNKDFLVNIEQIDENIVLNFFSPKYAYVPKEVVFSV